MKSVLFAALGLFLTTTAAQAATPENSVLTVEASKKIDDLYMSTAPVGAEILKPKCDSGKSPVILVTASAAEDIGEGQPLSGIRAYADDKGDTWRVRLQVKTYKGWLNDLPENGKVEVGGIASVAVKCSNK